MPASLIKKSDRIPETTRPSKSSAVKTRWKQSGKHVSLKQWVRQQRLDQNKELPFHDWVFNKRAKTSKPQQCIGRTNRVKSKKSA